MLQITVQRGDAIMINHFPEDQKGEKRALKFLETIRDSQFSGQHKAHYLKTLREKKANYNFRYFHKGKKLFYPGVVAAIRPEALKVTITHVPDLVAL